MGGWSVLLAVMLPQYREKEGSLTAGSQLRLCQPVIPEPSTLAKSSLYLDAVNRRIRLQNVESDDVLGSRIYADVKYIE